MEPNRFQDPIATGMHEEVFVFLSVSSFSYFSLFFNIFLPPSLPISLFSFLSPPLCPSSFHFDDDLARSPIMTNDVEDIISRNDPVFVLIAPCYLSLGKGRERA